MLVGGKPQRSAVCWLSSSVADTPKSQWREKVVKNEKCLFSLPAKICSHRLQHTLFILPGKREKWHPPPDSPRTAVMTEGHVGGTHFHLLHAKHCPTLWKIIMYLFTFPCLTSWIRATRRCRSSLGGIPLAAPPGDELVGQEGRRGWEGLCTCGCHFALSNQRD